MNNYPDERNASIIFKKPRIELKKLGNLRPSIEEDMLFGIDDG